jgi:hypothetical protein
MSAPIRATVMPSVPKISLRSLEWAPIQRSIRISRVGSSTTIVKCGDQRGHADRDDLEFVGGECAASAPGATASSSQTPAESSGASAA